MGLPTPTQWQRFSTLRLRLEPLAEVERREALLAIRSENPDDARVVSLLASHFAMPAVSVQGIGSGDRIDDFVLGARLGSGGMGVVYEATQSLGEASRLVAIKLISPLLWGMAKEDTRRRFADEIKAQAALQYDGLARLYTAGAYADPATQCDVPYLVMELVRGARPVTDFAGERTLTVEDRLRLFQRICRALQHAHDHRIIHRDIKPANILVDSEGRPFVVDFGLAQTADAALPGATMVTSGTVAYMSPEQLSPEFGPISEKTDTYSLGVVLYELLTGSKPYETSLDDSLEQLTKVITEEPPKRPSEHNADLGEEIESIVLMALSKQPGDRPTIGALGSQLAHYLVQQSSPSSGGPTPAVSRRSLWSGFRRRVSGLLIGILSIAVVYIFADRFIGGREAPISRESSIALEKSIAVLPFINRSASADDVHFVDGIHDDILMQLAQLSALDKVISRTSTERYRDTTKPMLEIGEELGVATILEGGVQRAGDRVRINVQLVDAATDKHLWVGSYDRELTAEDLFAIQSEVSREIVLALHAVLSDEDDKRLKAVPTTSLEAYGEYVLGRRAMATRKADALHQAQAHFEKAIELDTNYALAYIGLADAVALMPFYAGENLEESYAPRQTAIDRALALDPLSGEAYAALAVLVQDQGKIDEAEGFYQKAIELNPNYATAHHWYALLLAGRRDFENALAQIQRALELDPTSPNLASNLAAYLRYLGRAEEAHPVLLKAVERDPEFSPLYRIMGEHHLAAGRVGEGMRWIRASVKMSPLMRTGRFAECWFYLEFGDDEAVENCLQALGKDFPDASFIAANLHLFRLEPQAAVDLWERIAIDNLRDQSFLATLYIVNGEPDKAGPVLEKLSPESFGNEDVVFSPDLLWLPTHAAYTLYVDGRLERANYLFDQVLTIVQSMNRTRGNLYAYAWQDVFIHVTRGETQKAIFALREFKEIGVPRRWWMLRSQVFDRMRAEPEWNALISEFEADIARQRIWYEVHKDDPLF